MNRAERRAAERNIRHVVVMRGKNVEVRELGPARLLDVAVVWRSDASDRRLQGDDGFTWAMQASAETPDLAPTIDAIASRAQVWLDECAATGATLAHTLDEAQRHAMAAGLEADAYRRMAGIPDWQPWTVNHAGARAAERLLCSMLVLREFGRAPDASEYRGFMFTYSGKPYVPPPLTWRPPAATR